jgi:uncharacterized protein with HEPN domain
MPRDYNLHLEDILEAIGKIKTYMGGMSRQDFLKDEKTRDAVLRNLEVIGEAAKGVPEEIRAQHPGIEWRKMAGLRDILIHHYFGIDLEIIWDIVENKLDELETQIKTALPLNNDGRTQEG